MAGHSHWKQIKSKKLITDQKKSKTVSKLLNAISAAARGEPNPQFNPRLRTTIEKAREANVPQDNIERAIKRSQEAGDKLEEITVEAYGPEGVAIIIEAVTNNKNRTVQEIKTILKNCAAKWAEPGSVLWAFEKTGNQTKWTARFKKEVSEESEKQIKKLTAELETNEDVQETYTNATI